MRIGVIGAGALGLYYGALLQRAGHDLHFLLRRDYKALTRDGLKVTSPQGDFSLAQVKGYQKPEQIGTVELVLVGLKTYANARLVEMVKPLVGTSTTVLTLQNGLGNEDLLADAFGKERVLGGVAFLCCNRGKPGTVHHLDQGAVRLAEFCGGLTKRLHTLCEVFAHAGIPCEPCADLIKIRWEKLVWNIPFNGLCALTKRSTDQLLACNETHQLILELMKEVVAAANRQHFLPKIDEPAFISKMMDATSGMGAYRPSMMIDRLEKRPLELCAIYKKPLERARAVNSDMIRVNVLYSLLKATEGL